MKNLHKLGAAALLSSLVSGVSFAQSGPEVTPYRPGAAFGSAISAAGYFELETSFDTAKGGGLRADAFGNLLKYGVSDTTTFLVSIPYLKLSEGGRSESGLGDASLGFKYVQKLDKVSAAGVQLMTTVPTGKKSFSSDDPTISLTGIYGADFAGLHGDLNAGLRYNTASGAGSKSTFAWVAALSGPFANGLGWYGEVSGTNNSDAGSTSMFLGALTYTVNRNLALDASISRARAGGANATGFGVGLTYLFSK